MSTTDGSRRVGYLGLLLVGLAAVGGSLLASCGLGGRDEGLITEVERGRNGASVEVKDGRGGEYEVYLVERTTCEEGEYVQDCADRDDYLVPPPSYVPGINPSTPASSTAPRDDD